MKFGFIADTLYTSAVQSNVEAAITEWNNSSCDFVVVLGNSATTQSNLQDFVSLLDTCNCPVYYCSGEKDITESTFLTETGMTDIRQTAVINGYNLVFYPYDQLSLTQDDLTFFQKIDNMQGPVLLLGGCPLWRLNAGSYLDSSMEVFRRNYQKILLNIGGFLHNIQYRYYSYIYYGHSFNANSFSYNSSNSYGVANIDDITKDIQISGYSGQDSFSLAYNKAVSSTPSGRIGSWEMSKCIYAVLPGTLQNKSVLSGSDSFPVYFGPKAETTVVSSFLDVGKYINNVLDFSGSANAGLEIPYEVPYREGLGLTISVRYSSSSGFVVYGVSNYSAVYGAELNGIELRTQNEGPNIGYVIKGGSKPSELHANPHVVLRLRYNKADMFINGIKINNPSSAIPYYGRNKVGKFQLGTLTAIPNNGIAGNIYQFIVYQGALTDTEIAELDALGPDLGGLKGFNNGDGTMRLWYPYAAQDSLNKRLNKVEGATDVQNNIPSAINVYTSKSGNITGQRQDFLFN